jgi:hypothetical protein
MRGVSLSLIARHVPTIAITRRQSHTQMKTRLSKRCEHSSALLFKGESLPEVESTAGLPGVSRVPGVLTGSVQHGLHRRVLIEGGRLENATKVHPIAIFSNLLIAGHRHAGAAERRR